MAEFEALHTDVSRRVEMSLPTQKAEKKPVSEPTVFSKTAHDTLDDMMLDLPNDWASAVIDPIIGFTERCNKQHVEM